jgi:hypothetical protein
VASGKMPLKPTMIDFRAKILGLASKNLLIIKLNSRDHFNEEVNCHLNPLLVIFNLFGDFVEEEFEVLLVVKILDDQTDHVIQQMQLVFGNGSLSVTPLEKLQQKVADYSIAVFWIFKKDLPLNRIHLFRLNIALLRGNFL